MERVTSFGGLDLALLRARPADRRLDPRLHDALFLRPHPLAQSLDGAAPPVEPGLPGPGAIADKYRIEELVGTGGFAVVYRARHLLLDVPVALKLVRPSVLARRPEMAARLDEEAGYAARIHHRNVVRVYHVTRAAQVPCVVMEYIDGPDLSVMLRRRGRLPARMMLKVALHVAAGLRAGLQQGLIHRDIKPSNVLLTRTGRTKIVDFGLARPSAAAPGRHRDAIAGTVGYMAPEQYFRPADVDFRADVYSLGATLYHALVGQPPLAVEDVERCMAAHRAGLIMPPHRRASGIDVRVSDIIMWLLRSEPDRRPASYDELITALAQLLERL